MGRAPKLIRISLVLIAISGCTLNQSAFAPPPAASSSSPAPTIAQSSAADIKPKESPPPLPFKGRLIDGNPEELPSTVANSLTKESPVTFAYREELSHDDYHIPLIVSAFDPVTYVGAPLGDFGVTAFASLTIFDGDRVIGDYTAKTHVSRSYTLYHEPTHREVEDAARAAVREKIDAKLALDSDRLAAAVSHRANGASGNP
jgi:hypothetical protein